MVPGESPGTSTIIKYTVREGDGKVPIFRLLETGGSSGTSSGIRRYFGDSFPVVPTSPVHRTEDLKELS